MNILERCKKKIEEDFGIIDWEFVVEQPDNNVVTHYRFKNKDGYEAFVTVINGTEIWTPLVTDINDNEVMSIKNDRIEKKYKNRNRSTINPDEAVFLCYIEDDVVTCVIDYKEEDESYDDIENVNNSDFNRYWDCIEENIFETIHFTTIESANDWLISIGMEYDSKLNH